jgi:hypothetical protein
VLSLDCFTLPPPSSLPRTAAERSPGQQLTGSRLADTLLAALLNVRRELKFFETSAAKYGLDLTVRAVSGGLRRYRELFEEAGSAVENWGTAGDGGARETQLLQGLVVLWGTEVVCSPLSLESFSSFYAALVLGLVCVAFSCRGAE